MAKKNSLSRGIVWVILLLLIVGLAGFGATSFGGSVRSVATIGQTEVSTDRYANALQQEIRGLEAQTGQRLTMSQAQQFGLDQSVLQRLLALAAMEDEVADLGLSVGDEQVSRDLLSIPAFQGLDGQFDRLAYQDAIARSGQTVADFEESLRTETARTVLQGAVIAGILPPDVFIDTLYDYARETRDLTVLRYGPDDLAAPVGDPSEEALQAFYEANPALFTLPERRNVTYAWLTPQMLADDVTVDEDTLRRAYQDRIDDFVQPERRLVERLVYPDDATAQAAADAIAAGTTTFEAEVALRGLALPDIDLGDVARDDLGAAADAVFAVAAPGIAGPAPTPLGPALFRVNGVLAAQEVPFEEAAPELRVNYALDSARRAIEEEIDPVEDLLASGATLEEVAQETALRLGSTTWSETEGGLDGANIDADPAFRQAAAAAQIGDFPEVAQLSDGGLFALRLDEVLAPAVLPLAEGRAAAIDAWRLDAQIDALSAQAEAAGAALAEGADPATLGGVLSRQTALARDAFLEDLPVETVTAAFAMEQGATRVLRSQDGAVLIRPDTIAAPDGTSAEAREVKDSFRAQTGQGIAADMTAAFTAALQAQKGISINNQAVAAVNAQFN